ncbi:alpha/beta fold hydrolase [Brevibacillus composti]|uniref:alpha/beta fold hydrolase n=1 Tax=Brevibacillus composti TaxID=2796470 RepID=UPI001E3FF3ED|nr:alpha/beta hydrolase [Brevibacillus composti]
MREIGLLTPPAGAIRTLEAMRERPDRLPVLRELALPILLVAGEEDQIIEPGKTFVIAGPRVEQVLLADCGHMGMLEDSERMAEAITQFLSKI